MMWCPVFLQTEDKVGVSALTDRQTDMDMLQALYSSHNIQTKQTTLTCIHTSH